MKPHDFRILLKIIILLSVFLGSVLPLYAGGAKERNKDMAYVNELVAKKNYNEAIRVLSSLIRKNDEYFDLYQTKLRIILRRFNNYPELANVLLDIVDKHPEDLETILRISNELAEMNTVRDKETEKYIANVEVLARLSVNRRILNSILVEGRALLDNKQYLAALHKYQSGFDLYLAQMYRDDFDQDLVNTTRRYLVEINNYIAALAPLIANFESTGTAITNADGNPSNRQAYVNFYNGLLPQMGTLTRIKSSMIETANFWTRQDDKNLASGNDLEGRFFFTMAPAFIWGRVENKQWIDPALDEAERKSLPYRREGILGALDAIWKIAIDPLENKFESVSDSMYNESVAAADKGSYGFAVSNKKTITDFDETPLALVSQWHEFTLHDHEKARTILGKQVDPGRIDGFLRYNAINESAAYLEIAGNLGNRFSTELNDLQTTDNLAAWQSGKISADEAIKREKAAKNTYKGLTNETEKAIAENDKDAVRYKTITATNKGSQYFDKSHRVLEDILRSLNVGEVKRATKSYTLITAVLDSKINDMDKLFNEGNTLAAGVPLNLDTGETVNAKYPRQALVQWNTVEEELNSSIDLSRTMLEDHRAEPPRVANNADITRLRSQAAVLSQRLARLQTTERGAAALARSNLTQAENLEKQGDNAIAQARRSLYANNFSDAHNQVERASVNYADSLNLQENPRLRSALMSVVVPLNAEITLAERAYVENEVQVLISSARDTYFEGNFERAEQQLVRAENRWASVSTDNHDELNYWLTIVRGALTLRSGRNIPITAPLYPEMSQLLSSAQKNYNEGVRLLSTNQRSDGIQKLTVARQKTQEVRLMFPVNQDAGILELKIDRVIDPKSFDQAFQQRFAAAIAGTKRRSIESYADLQNLAAINPGYSGMNAALVQAEIDMGIRPPPPDTRALRRSAELVAAAQRLFQAQIRSQYPVALSNVNDALRLNPNNIEAIQLKDRIQTAMGANAAVSAEDIQTEQEYIRAVNALQNNNKLLAMSIVERLLQNPKNKSSVRINDLKRRIDASM
ncbi:MAG: hypothetical protein Ta2B_25450 [Termitinemataceae bacterium]|nr:MAG: hypothetical protein Ta2B_25450 [Termitinemataceae bacterium]